MSGGNDHDHRQKNRPAFLAPLAILLAVAALACWSMYQLIETAGLVTHTHQVIEKIDALLVSLENAEAEQRGYLLTDEEPSCSRTRPTSPAGNRK